MWSERELELGLVGPVGHSKGFYMGEWSHCSFE